MTEADKSVAADRLMQILENIAAEGGACPTNAQLAKMLGFRSTSPAVRLVRRLETENAICVERGACTRAITILATGKRIASVNADNVKPVYPKARNGKRLRSASTLRRVEIAKDEARRAGDEVERDSAGLIGRPAAQTAPSKGTVDRRPIALSLDPCPRCGTRGDLGCAHQQPFPFAQEHFPQTTTAKSYKPKRGDMAGLNFGTRKRRMHV